MTKILPLKSIPLSLAAILLAACGGGSGGSDPVVATPPTSPPNTGGISRNGIAIGPISNFGSIVVNGVRYETDAQTAFDIDEDPNSRESDLDVGDTVIVVAELDTDTGISTALQVIYDDAVTGPISSIDATADTFVVLGQTVQVVADTSFDDGFTNPQFEGLSVGQIVEVSGLPSSTGVILATRLEPESPGTTLEVRGVVESLDTVSQTLSINALTVDFSTAVLEGFPGTGIENGDLVEVEGASLNGNGELVATEVELEDELPGLSDDDFVEVEGLVTRFADAADFDVAGFTVITNSTTEFSDGTAADLGLDVRVEIEGSIGAKGALIAEEVQFRPENDIVIAAALDSVDVTASNVVVLGITVSVGDVTKIEDNSDIEMDPLGLGDLAAGDFVEISASINPDNAGQVRAASLERENADDTFLEGPIDAFMQPTITVLGVTSLNGEKTC
ncbi:MAG: DUF5666 domain-containing protein [Pseudomonadota bacterium]